jgi:hypothetical protein
MRAITLGNAFTHPANRAFVLRSLYVKGQSHDNDHQRDRYGSTGSTEA